jgi:orotate phosphoribosyltransferase
VRLALDRAELAAAIDRTARLTGTFTLRSGQVASDYFDKYRFEADPALLAAVVDALCALIPAETEILAGLELGGVPLATALALRTGIPAAFVRKTAKTYGTSRLAEGADVRGRHVLVIEDVVTSGGQVAISADQLRELGATVTAAVCVIDREEGGAERLAADGIELRPLYPMSELDAAQPGRGGRRAGPR